MTAAWNGPPPQPVGADGERRVLEAVVAGGPAGGGGSFFVDPEKAEECIRELRGAVDGLAVGIENLYHKLPFPPPGQDIVSVNASQQSYVMADRAINYLEAWREQIDRTALNLQLQLEAYRRTEEHNGSMFA